MGRAGGEEGRGEAFQRPSHAVDETTVAHSPEVESEGQASPREADACPPPSEGGCVYYPGRRKSQSTFALKPRASSNPGSTTRAVETGSV